MSLYSRYSSANVMPNSEVERRFGIAAEPCPFCHLHNVGMFIGPSPHITCMSCGADGPLNREKDIQHRQYISLRQWNNR